MIKEKIDSKFLYGKIAGCLLGGALGDALGYEVEFDEWDEIRKRFGEKGIRRPELHKNRAVFSDDTQMTLFTLEGMIIGYWRANAKGIGAPVEVYVWQSYLSWLKSQGIEPENNIYGFDSISELLKNDEIHARRAPGRTCISALSSGEMGKIEKPLNQSKGCGGVMRTAPLGFMKMYGNPIVNGARTAAITHGHPLGYLPAGILSGIVYQCIYENKDGKSLQAIIEQVIQETAELFPEQASYMEELDGLLHIAMDLATSDIDDLEAINELGEGWVGDEALAIAVYSCLKYPHAYQMKQALICAANHSGDSDSTAAIAGNILGAYHGLDALDMRWVYQLQLRQLIMEYARRTVEVILWKEYRLDEECDCVIARTDDFMKKYEVVMDIISRDQMLRNRCAQYHISEDENHEYLFDALFDSFYRDVCYLRNHSYFYGNPANRQPHRTDLPKWKEMFECMETLIKMIDSDYEGKFISAAIASGRVHNRISQYLNARYSKEQEKKPDTAVQKTVVKGRSRERKKLCLDDQRIWFLSTFFDANGNVEKYSLDQETASDSHYEFKDAASIRKKISQPGDDELSFGELLRRYTLENGGWKTLDLIRPYITAQFHYD